MKQLRIMISLLAILTLLAGMFALPAAATDTSAGNVAGHAAEVLRLVNAERKKAGLAQLRAGSPSLSAAANKRAQEIATRFSHTRPNGGSCFSVLDEYNVSSTARGENIAYGYGTPAQVVEGWMQSSGHRANILGDYEALGVGVYVKNGTLYWAQLFIREGGAAKQAAGWRAWPAWMQWLMKIFLFGWIWM